MNVKLTLEYDGTDYYGWQIQPDRATVQEAVERALAQILGAPVRVCGAGRTDAGVHALGQTAHFECAKPVDLKRLQKGLNALLRPAIVVKAAEAASGTFDARRDALSRVYQYRIWNCPWPSAFYARYSWHVHQALDWTAMAEAARAIIGEHDFSSFRAAGCDASHAVRKVCASSVRRERDFIVYEIEASAFLRHMVRNIVGTLVLVGRGELSVAGFSDILKLRDRSRAGPTAPARGLFLVEVKYETDGSGLRGSGP
ncbi:MAG TPA: tRNA pseudouridine(38-40) synthase TruA [Candidatus Acidoferrales bacterium]|nr:tRNA pseudouridine(38-40) synthase TruA [Candidatus Acidoferrales bacterium]